MRPGTVGPIAQSIRATQIWTTMSEVFEASACKNLHSDRDWFFFKIFFWTILFKSCFYIYMY